MSTIALLLTSFFVSILIGVISKGEWMYGLKYFLPLFIVSGIFFLGANELIGGILTAFGAG